MAMSSEVTQLLDRLGLSHYQQRLADNGFDSLECLYAITEHDFETLNIECGDRRTLQQELRGREAQDGSGDLTPSSTNSLWHGTPGTEVSAVVNNDQSAGALSNPELESTSRYEVFHPPRNMHGSLQVEGPHSEDWGYLINTSDSFSQTIMLHKKRPSITSYHPSNFDRHAENTEQERSQSNGNSTGGYLIGRHLESDIIVDKPYISNRHCVIFWVNNSAGGMAVLEDLSANGTAVNEVVVGRNNLLELHDNDKVRVADKPHFLFRYSIHNTPTFEQHYTLMDDVGKGHFATVFSCTERATEVVYAVKIVVEEVCYAIKGDPLQIRREGDDVNVIF